MATVKVRRGGVPVRLTPEEEAFNAILTPEQIEQNAISDPDSPPMTEEELVRASIARHVRCQREKSGLSQAKFAKRFQINPARLRDWEQGRSKPDSVALAYLKVIEKNPKAVDEALVA
jgi:putative transcriptional regulator